MLAAADVVCRERAVAFGLRRLSDVVASEVPDPIVAGNSSESLARVNLARWCYGLDAGSPSHMRPRVIEHFGNRVDAFVYRAGVEGDPDAEHPGQRVLRPINVPHPFAKRQRKQPGLPDAIEDHIQAIAPRILHPRILFTDIFNVACIT